MAIDSIKKNLQSLVEAIQKKEIFSNHPLLEAYAYIYGTAELDYSFTRRKYVPSDYYLAPASELYEEWYETCEYVTSKGRESIPYPDKLNLIDYLNSLSMAIYKNEKRLNWIKSLFSFLNYLREDMNSDDVHFLETLFPLKKELKQDYHLQPENGEFYKTQITYLLRKVEPEEHPIDVVIYADVIKELIKQCLYSRSNAFQGAVEALGFVWLCFVSASYGLMYSLKELHDVHSSALTQEIRPAIRLESLAGERKLPISETIYKHFKFLSSSHQKPTILSRSLPSLRRPFNAAVEKCPNVVSVGKITFATMLAMPHEAIGHRTKIIL